MSEKILKVTDRRMFTPDGQLREDYLYLEEKLEHGGSAPEPAAVVEEPAPAPPPAAAGRREPELPQPDRSQVPSYPAAGYDAPTMMELISLLAEPAAVYLGDARYPNGPVEQNLELARLHIDLLGLLREKTLGNLDAREQAVLDDVLYRLRTSYVQKRG